MRDDAVSELRFKLLIPWGGVFLSLLGLVLVVTGDVLMGLLAAAAGALAWLFARRRMRRARS